MEHKNYFKQPRVKSKKITNSARGQNCSLRTKYCRPTNETVVFCHAPCVDHGMGYKGPDWWGGFGCDQCHAYVDGRLDLVIGLTREDRLSGQWKNFNWCDSIYETQKILFQIGVIKI